LNLEYETQVSNFLGKNVEGEKFECEPGSRLAEACIEIYQPVCGWNDDTIKCFAYPCASTYGNSCKACQNEVVEYYTSGECPLPGN
jgi:hypothetical protein